MSNSDFSEDYAGTKNSQQPGTEPQATGASKQQKEDHNKNGIPDADEERMLANEALLVCEQGIGDAKIKLAAAHGVNDSAPDAILANDKIFTPFSFCKTTENTSHICTHPLLTPRWLNTHKERVINGQESVTTKSFLICAYNNAIIQPKTDGQVEEKPERKGKLVFFIHGLGAGWTEFDTMISGTYLEHDADGTVMKGSDQQGALKRGLLRKKIEGLVQLDAFFQDAGVISSRREPGPDEFRLENAKDFPGGKSEEDKTAVHNCIPLMKNELFDWLKENKRVCIKVEFSTGVESFEQQLTEMTSMVNAVAAIIEDAMQEYEDDGNRYFIYDTAFVGHSMGGIAAVNFGMKYAAMNPERMVDIITISTPYYENFWAKAEVNSPVVKGILGRPNYGAQDDLAGYTANIIKVQNDWNNFAGSVASKNTNLGAIGIKAQGALDGYTGSDYIVPADIQLAYMPKAMKDDIQQKKNMIQRIAKEHGSIEPLETHYDENIKNAEVKLEKAKQALAQRKAELIELHNERWPNGPEWKDVNGELVNYEASVSSAELKLTKAKGERVAINILPTLVQYQKVKRLKLVKGSDILRDTAGMPLMSLSNHHVNTPDLPDTIKCVKDALLNGVSAFEDDPEAVKLYGS